MSDLLVKLYELPDLAPALAEARARGIAVRRALAPEKHVVIEWVRRAFDPMWASECDVAFANRPISCFVAVEAERLVGFACYDATAKDFFGPTGVAEAERRRGIGRVLLLASLHAMAEQGYAYAIIGGVGPTEFYASAVGATEIAGSAPGIYRGLLRGT